MNERIEKLALQAKIQFTYDPTEKPIRAFAECWEDELEKFAELIIRECMSIADGQKKYVEDMEVFNEQDATWNKARIQQSQQIIDNIKNHFGVE